MAKKSMWLRASSASRSQLALLVLRLLQLTRMSAVAIAKATTNQCDSMTHRVAMGAARWVNPFHKAMKSISIIGAGMAGLVAANLLRRYNPVVFERQQILPHNHSALLRFRSPAVGDATSVPFVNVKVRKGIWDGHTVRNDCTILTGNHYSRNASGSYGERSIWNMAPADRWLSPPDFVEQISRSVDVRLNVPFSLLDHGQGTDDHIAISTLPMPVMMAMTKYPGPVPEFKWSPIFTIKLQLDCDSSIYQTIYNGGEDYRWYRATVHGTELTVECSIEPSNHFLADTVNQIVHSCFGICLDHYRPVERSLVKRQEYGKIVPTDEAARRGFILWLTEKYHIYSLGRFATWRQILLDDIVADVKMIEKLFLNPSTYTRKIATVS